MAEKIDTRQQILDAAMERIMHYGYGKTTIAEIANDCCMSTGNIYRFFASKLDIAEAIARQFNSVVHQSIGALVRGPGSAADKLRKLHQEALKATFEKLDHNAKILELADILTHQRPNIIDEEEALERVHIVQILQQGVKDGDFAPLDNAEAVAAAIQSATMKFRYPQLFSRMGLEELQQRLDGVMTMLIAGLRQSAKTLA